MNRGDGAELGYPYCGHCPPLASSPQTHGQREPRQSFPALRKENRSRADLVLNHATRFRPQTATVNEAQMIDKNGHGQVYGCRD